jgi:hypothetical protein
MLIAGREDSRTFIWFHNYVVQAECGQSLHLSTVETIEFPRSQYNEHIPSTDTSLTLSQKVRAIEQW